MSFGSTIEVLLWRVSYLGTHFHIFLVGESLFSITAAYILIGLLSKTEIIIK